MSPRGVDWQLPCWRDQREMRALRVLALDDPLAAWHVHRTHNDLAAIVGDAFGGRVDGIDVEIELPERNRDLRRLVHDATAGFRAGREGLINAHLAHVELAGAGPAELA